MPTFHLITPVTRRGDAVTNDLLGMRRWLRRRGYPVHVYAEQAPRSLRRLVRSLREYQEHWDNPDDVLIYHHSMGWPAGLALFRRSRNRRVVKYHNITPGVFFRAYDPLLTLLCSRGRRQTQELVRGADLLLADSAFNAEDLVAAGADPGLCHVVHPFHDLARRDSAGDPTLAARLRGQRTFLFVGRLAPNKGHRHLIRAFAEYHHHVERTARLVIVGGLSPPLPAYREELEREVRRGRVDGAVVFVGAVPDRQLRTYYAHARAFLCASEHEGFCVPLIEAMYHRLPVVAYGCSAIRETLGSAGLVWETPEPTLFAESLRQLEEDPPFRAAVVRGQWQRYCQRFTTQAIARSFAAALAPLLARTATHA